MHLDAIKLFCDVAEQRSVSKAAESAGLTQSAVSQRIIALEKELGVRLIDRSKRPLKLTGAGSTYHHGCRQILDQYERLTRRIMGAEGVLRGRVRIAAIYSAGIDLLNQVADDFCAAYPQVAVEVNYYQPEEVLARVRRDLADLGIVSYPQRWRDVEVTPLRDEVMVVVCPPHHELADREVLGPGELAGRPMVGFDPELPISRRLHAYFRKHGSTAHVAHTFDNIDTIKVYLGHSDEVAILPERTVRREVASGALKAVALEPRLSRPLAIVNQRQRPLTPAISGFIDHMLEHGTAGGPRVRTAEAEAAEAREAVAAQD